MRKSLLMLCILAVASWATAANDGSALWFASSPKGHCKVVVDGAAGSATLDIARNELAARCLAGRVTLTVDPTLQLGDGFRLTDSTITASTDIGVLYGAYELLRLQDTHRLATLPKTETPTVRLRIINHWDNLDGSVERGYAGNSIFKWEEITGGANRQDMHVGQQLHDRLVFYARANASIGINGTVLNNVNASPKMMTTAYINKVKAIADILRPYGIPGGEGESLPTCRLQPPLAPRQTACQS